MSLQEGRRRRDAALARVGARCGEDYEVRRVWNHALSVVHSRETFTSEDIIARCGGVEFAEPRRLGALMRDLALCELAEPTSIYVQATRPTRHVGTVRVWRSLVFRPTKQENHDQSSLTTHPQ